MVILSTNSGSQNVYIIIIDAKKKKNINKQSHPNESKHSVKFKLKKSYQAKHLYFTSNCLMKLHDILFCTFYKNYNIES